MRIEAGGILSSERQENFSCVSRYCCTQTRRNTRNRRDIMEPDGSILSIAGREQLKAIRSNLLS